MNIISTEIFYDPNKAQRIIKIGVGIDECDSHEAVAQIAKVIHEAAGKELQKEVMEEIKKQLPELVKSIGSDIALDGIKQLVKEDKECQ